MSIIILKKIYTIVRVIMRKIWVDIEQYWITKDFT
jgi:hypothetical protein